MSTTIDRDTASRVKKIISGMTMDKVALNVALDDETPLFFGEEDASAIFDSFEAVMMFIQLENEFDFQIADDDMDMGNFNSINLIAKYIDAHASETARK